MDPRLPKLLAVRAAIAFVAARGGMLFDGVTDKHGGGRPNITSDALDKKILRAVFNHRGRAKVTIQFLQKKITEARAVSRSTLQRRFANDGLAWLRRRRKSYVASVYKPARCLSPVRLCGKT